MYTFKKYLAMAAFAIAISSVLIVAAQAPPAGQRGGQGQGGGARGQRGGQAAAEAAPAPLGLTVTGEVQNYVPVTDAMLKNPDPGDWLMIRRDYHASDYSPLSQITRDNVKDLRLQWVWSMTEGARTQAAPIVHNGIMYLNNAGNVLQALDAR